MGDTGWTSRCPLWRAEGKLSHDFPEPPPSSSFLWTNIHRFDPIQLTIPNLFTAAGSAQAAKPSPNQRTEVPTRRGREAKHRQQETSPSLALTLVFFHP